MTSITLCFKCFLYLCVLNFARTISENPKLLIVSFDGFRYDYFDAFQPQRFVEFAKTGVRATNGMLASFPTRTFPNHYTLVTGLYPESHGIVDNAFFDEVYNDTFYPNKTETKWFDAGTPIWISARLQGLTTAAFFWVGSETELRNTTPNFYKHFNKSVPWAERVDTVVNWFASDNVSFAALYFEEPDDSGHKYGSFSEGVRIQIEKLDATLGDLLDKLKTNDLLDKVDIILTSDHGMTNLSLAADENLILNEHLAENDFQIPLQVGPVAPIIPLKGKEVEIRDKLNKVTPNVKVYLKSEIPEEFHYRNNRRITPLLAIGNEGYQTMVAAEDLIKTGKIGNHGYNNSLLSMRPVFLASGPSFKKDYLLTKTFENVNLYPLMCHILGIKPDPNNGTLENLREILSDESVSTTTTADSTTHSSNGQYCDKICSWLHIFTCLIFCFIFNQSHQFR